MSKHTPGPWMTDPDDREGMEWNIHIVQADAPDNRICFMASDGPEANANLIAAAPDMLAALEQNAVELAEAANLLRGCKLPGAASLFEMAATRTKATIAKARKADLLPVARTANRPK